VDPERLRDPHEVEYGELPELARALRALGSARRSGGSMQSQFFFPLLDARRRAAEARSAIACLRMFDCGELGRCLDRAIERIAANWPDARPSARRALRAELFERANAYTDALAVLSERAREALGADETHKLAAWRAWTRQLAATFDAADRAWMAMRTVVDALPPSPTRR